MGFPGSAGDKKKEREKKPPANAGDSKRHSFVPWVWKILWSRKW